MCEVVKYCVKCGSQAVSCEARVSWDIAEQKWILSNIFTDRENCAKCGDKAIIIERMARMSELMSEPDYE